MPSLPRRKDPLYYMLDYIREQRTAHANELAIGRWEGEGQARELVGRVRALDDVLNEMETYRRAPGGFAPTEEGNDIQ